MSYKSLSRILAGLSVFAMIMTSGFGTVASVKATDIPDDGCTPNDSQVYVSNGDTIVGDESSAAVLDPIPDVLPGAWSASIPDASWIWSENPPAPGTEEGDDVNQVFTQNFEIVGNPLDSTLDIAADNFYTVAINGTPFDTGTSGTDLDNYSSSGQDQWSIPAEALQTGSNTLEVTVTNPGGYGEFNPAGLLYKLTVESETCPSFATLTIVKQVDGEVNSEGGDTFNFNITGTDVEFSESTSVNVDENNGNNSTEQIQLPAGSYDVTENASAGWHLADAECEYYGESVGVSVAGGENITVDDDDHVT